MPSTGATRRRQMAAALRGGSRRPARGREIDRQLAIAALTGRLIDADWQVWKRDPTTYSGPILNGLFYLFLDRLLPTADLVDARRGASRAGASCPPTGTREPRSGTRRAAHRRARSGLGACRRRYVRETLPNEGETDSQRERLRTAGAAAGDAFDEFVAFLDQLAQQAHGEWAYARSATAASCASASGSTSMLGRCARWVATSTRGWTPR